MFKNKKYNPGVMFTYYYLDSKELYSWLFITKDFSICVSTNDITFIYHDISYDDSLGEIYK